MHRGRWRPLVVLHLPEKQAVVDTEQDDHNDERDEAEAEGDVAQLLRLT